MLRRFVRLPSEKRRLLACIHRVAHHRNTTRLLWLYDMRLPVNSMDAEELESFARVARSKQVTAVVADGLDPAAIFRCVPAKGGFTKAVYASPPSSVLRV